MHDILKRARDQGIRYDERSSAPYQAAVVARVAETLGGRERPSVQRWSSNFNADFYRLRVASDDLMLKIMVSKPAAVLDIEFDSLRSLAGIARDSGRFRVPEPRGRFTELSAYVTDYEEGRLLTSLFLSSPPSSDAIVDGARRCGLALADIHRAWAVPDTPMDAQGVVDDLLANAGWRFTRRERESLDGVVARLHGHPVRHARLYLDFDPVNVLVGADAVPCLLDPPELALTGPVHWDVGVFILGLRRAGWRRPWSARRSRALGVVAGRAFLDAYYTGSAATPDPLDTTATTLFELVRLAQLSAWWLAPAQFRYKATGVVRSACAWPLIRAERRLVFRELARSLEQQ